MLITTNLIGFMARRREEEASGYSFTMTAGDLVATVQGYSDGSVSSAFGSIDAEPIPATDLQFLISGGAGNAIQFAGDQTALLAGKTVWVDGVEYPFTTDWSYDGSSSTAAEWTSGGPTFVNTVVYFVEIK